MTHGGPRDDEEPLRKGVRGGRHRGDLVAPKALTVAGRSERAGLMAAAVGVGLLLAGNVVEFYGVLLQEKPNAYAAAGENDHWVGSDIGWIIFGIGMLTLLVGGLTAAVGMQRHRVRPTWVIAFIATLGVGVLAANLLALQSVLLSVPVLALYAVGWIAFGLLTRQAASHDRPSVPRLERLQKPHRRVPRSYQ